MPLSDTAIRAAKPKDKTYLMTDGEGMYLEITPSGGKWWRFKYRFDGKQKRLSLGTYPDTGLKEAREKRQEARRLLATGVDPSENRKAKKAAGSGNIANSFEVIAREWFGRQEPTWVPSHSEKIISRLERDLFPWLGKRDIGTITAPELLPCSVASRTGARWRPHIGPYRTADRYSGTPSPQAVRSGIPVQPCAVPWHR